MDLTPEAGANCHTRMVLTAVLLCIAVAVLATLTSPDSSTASAHSPVAQLTQLRIGDFGPGWDSAWEEHPLDRRATSYRVVDDAEGGAVLRADSLDSASALVRPLDVTVVEGTLSWRWKVARSLGSNTDERRRRGDDYAARVFVIFGADPFSPGTRALCYVWAGTEEVGGRYPSPVTDGVATFVLESGDGSAGAWVSESRNFAQDYRTAFAAEPGPVGSIAIMVDTDDTGSRATAWFDELVVHSPTGRAPVVREAEAFGTLGSD